MSGTRTSLDTRVAAAFYGGFKELHPVQTAAVEPLAGGRNVVLSSGTGSGKTEAVVAPLLGRFWTDALRDERTVMLYIAPTKALINDIAKRLDGPLSQLGLRVGIRHGDRNDLRLASKPHVLVTTPESLNVMLRQKETVLAGIRCVVVDEIHLLFNTQRGLHLAILLWRLRRITGQPPQWAALSATIGNLPAVCSFFFGPSESADFLQFPATRTIEAQIRIIHSPTELRKLFVKLMDAPRRKLLVFANSRKKCETLAGELQRAGVLAPFVFTHYSSLSPELRERTERDFTEAPRAICIATSTLEIGIDIGDIDAVVLIGEPPDIASFLQRIGRGNRRSSKTNVIALCEEGPAADREAALFASLLNLGRAGMMPVSGPQRLWGAVVQQFLSLIQQEDGAYTPVADLVAEAGALPHLTRAAADEILAELAAVGILQKHGFKNRYGAGDGLWRGRRAVADGGEQNAVRQLPAGIPEHRPARRQPDPRIRPQVQPDEAEVGNAG